MVRSDFPLRPRTISYLSSFTSLSLKGQIGMDVLIMNFSDLHAQKVKMKFVSTVALAHLDYRTSFHVCYYFVFYSKCIVATCCLSILAPHM
jgi:hypothetical protein